MRLSIISQMVLVLVLVGSVYAPGVTTVLLPDHPLLARPGYYWASTIAANNERVRLVWVTVRDGGGRGQLAHLGCQQRALAIWSVDLERDGHEPKITLYELVRAVWETACQHTLDDLDELLLTNDVVARDEGLQAATRRVRDVVVLTVAGTEGTSDGLMPDEAETSQPNFILLAPPEYVAGEARGVMEAAWPVMATGPFYDLVSRLADETDAVPLIGVGFPREGHDQVFYKLLRPDRQGWRPRYREYWRLVQEAFRDMREVVGGVVNADRVFGHRP